MTYLDRIMRAVDYLESTLTGTPSLDEAADRACCSRFHFHRIFKALTGESAGAYVRRRRMAEACRDLLATRRTILDVAVAWGFESHEAFTRAFKKHFGQAPSTFRRTRRLETLVLKRPIDAHFLRNLQGGSTMEPRFVDLPAVTAVGLPGYFTKATTTRDIPALWCRFVPRMHDVPGRAGTHSYGICDVPADLPEGAEFRYVAAVQIDPAAPAAAAEPPAGMVRVDLPAARYAVFTHRGPIADIGRTYDYVYGTWLAQAPYEADGTHDFEYYGPRFDDEDPSSPASEVDIYLPVRPSA